MGATMRPSGLPGGMTGGGFGQPQTNWRSLLGAPMLSPALSPAAAPSLFGAAPQFTPFAPPAPTPMAQAPAAPAVDDNAWLNQLMQDRINSGGA